MANGKKSLVSEFVKTAPDKPGAVVEVSGDAPPDGGGAAEIVARLNLWQLKGTDKFFEIRGDRVVPRNQTEVTRLLRMNRVSDTRNGGSMFSDADAILEHIKYERLVDYAGPLCGQKVGVIEVQGVRLLITTSYKLIEPVPGDWPRLRALIEGLFITEEIDQTPSVYAWLKTAVESLRAGVRRPGHGLFLAGPSGGGKSFFQLHVITPLLGGRTAPDPTKYITDKTTFNAELFKSEHLAIQEMPSATDYQSRQILSEHLKRLIASETQSLHAKYGDALTVYPWWRVSLSINDEEGKLKSLPPLTIDFEDKILLLRCSLCPQNLPGPSPEEWGEFLNTITSELPAFMAFLLGWEIPAALRQAEGGSRFGFDAFHHPTLTAGLFEQEAESALLYALDSAIDATVPTAAGTSVSFYDEGAWGWGSAEALKEKICFFSPVAAELFKSRRGSFDGACGVFMAKLMKKFPNRVFKKRDGQGRKVWRVLARAE